MTIQAKATNPAEREPYQCASHGKFRRYYEKLEKVKNWGILWSTLAIVPLTLLLSFTEVSLGWVYLFMGVLVGSAVIPITLALLWPRVTALGMIFGAVGGTVVGVASWLGMASSFPGGLGNFFDNTGNQWSMFTGNIASILFGGFGCLVVSLIKPDVEGGRSIVERPAMHSLAADSRSTDQDESSASDDEGNDSHGRISESNTRNNADKRRRRRSSSLLEKGSAHEKGQRVGSADSFEEDNDHELEEDATKPTPHAWAFTRNIDNPLFPWTDFYTQELGILVAGGQLTNADRPALQTIERTFKSVKWTAYIGAIGLSLILILIWPGIQSTLGVQDLSGFNTWIAVAEGWACVVGIFIIVVPVAWEIRTIKAISSSSGDTRAAQREEDIGSSALVRQIPRWRRFDSDGTRIMTGVMTPFDEVPMTGVRQAASMVEAPYGRSISDRGILGSTKSVANDAQGVSVLGSVLDLHAESVLRTQKMAGDHTKGKASVGWEEQKKRLGF